MKKEFLIERQGKTFCTYNGLVDLATENGLKSIRTELIQIPSEANFRVAICKAVVTVETDGKERVFEGYGDAAPNNVAPAMQTCLIRMAETRAKSRALRDATNVAVAAFDDVEDESETPPERGSRPTAPTPPNGDARSEKPQNYPISLGAISVINARCKANRWDAGVTSQDWFGKSLQNLTATQGAEFIGRLEESAEEARLKLLETPMPLEMVGEDTAPPPPSVSEQTMGAMAR